VRGSAAAADTVLVDWVRQRTKKARRRVASVCTGAFLMAASGALDNGIGGRHYGIIEYGVK
jgi:transcriptional regulator GlxA family with amidase domain